jgi:glutathione S-transferase
MTPVLYSFRRCPYAIRARLAILSAGLEVELREVVLRDKPAAFLEASPSGTVPCLVNAGEVIDESLDVMIWALKQHDPEGWMSMPQAGYELIAEIDGPFKHALDRTKYADRYPGTDPKETARKGGRFPEQSGRDDRPVDLRSSQPCRFRHPALCPPVSPSSTRTGSMHRPGQISRPGSSDSWRPSVFAQIMEKYPQWHEGDKPILFGR